MLEELKDVEITVSEKVELICQIYLGRPTAEVQWYRNGKKIFDGGKYKITRLQDYTMSLIITESEETVSAIYRCEAVNKFGEVHTECDVVVLRTFRFLPTLTIILYCNIHAFYFYVLYIILYCMEWEIMQAG